MTEKHLPPAFNGCNCSCHRVPGMIHLVACCAPNMSDLSIDRAWFERRVALEDGVDIGAGHSIVDEASRERSVVIMSRALCQIDGLAPDDIAPRQLVCGPYGEVLPNWEAYREKAEGVLAGADAVDAARYRYLRCRDLDAISAGGVFAGMTPRNIVLNGEDLDEAVDAGLVTKKDA